MDGKRLTPAEAVFLLEPKASAASHCLQAALLNLLDAGLIAVEPRKSIWREPCLILRPGQGSAHLPTHVQAVEQALMDSKAGLRLDRTRVVHALQRSFGYSYGRFVHEHVAPALIARGLVERTDSKWLGLIPRIHYGRTGAGQALVRPLQRLAAALEELPSLIDLDPDKAIALARSAGALLVISPRARKQIPRLRRLIERRGGDPAPLVFVEVEEREPEWEQLFELGELALEFDLEGLLDSIEAVGDFTADGGSGSSDGGDGGGD